MLSSGFTLFPNGEALRVGAEGVALDVVGAWTLRGVLLAGNHRLAASAHHGITLILQVHGIPRRSLERTLGPQVGDALILCSRFEICCSHIARL